MNTEQQEDSWLARPSSIRLLWRIFWAVLALTVLAQAVVYVKGYFVVDGWIGFGAVFGFLSCVIMVVAAKVLGKVLKRDQDYYQEQEHD